MDEHWNMQSCEATFKVVWSRPNCLHPSPEWGEQWARSSHFRMRDSAALRSWVGGNGPGLPPGGCTYLVQCHVWQLVGKFTWGAVGTGLHHGGQHGLVAIEGQQVFQRHASFLGRRAGQRELRARPRHRPPRVHKATTRSIEAQPSGVFLFVPLPESSLKHQRYCQRANKRLTLSISFPFSRSTSLFKEFLKYLL